jgi:probable rRNA maturation factor
MLKYSINDPFHKVNSQIKQKIRLANNLISKLTKNNQIYDINIIDDRQTKIINKKYRQIDKTTDVLSFALHDANDIKTPLLGEIFINYQQALRQTKVSYEYEMVFLLIHGLLHLLGYDHKDKKSETEMFNLQNEIIQSLF